MTERTHPLREGLPSSTRAESQLRLLVETGLLLSREHSLETIVQAALDAGRELSGAAFGAFFSNEITGDGISSQLYKLSGPAEAFAALAGCAPAHLFAEALQNGGALCSDDVTLDPALRAHLHLAETRDPASSVRSVLTVPVVSRSGEVLGLFLYGHPAASVFTPESESLAATVAAQAATAIDNAHLARNLTREIGHADAARQHQRETSERLRQALDAAQLGTWSWNAANDLIDFDERGAQLFHVPPYTPINRTELRGRVVHRDDLPYSAGDLRDAIRTGALYQSEYRIQTPDGNQTWVAASGVPTYDQHARPNGMIGTVQDVTVRKTQEATLRQSEKLAATGRLAATIAHEINNPLEAITNLIYLCRTDSSSPPQIQRLLDAADDELARVAQIAQQTLGFYRDTTRPVEINLSALLQGIADLFSRKLKYKRLALRLELDPELSIYGLKGEIRQVFSNLLVNAIDASNSGEIRIRGRRRTVDRHEGVAVLISDQGTGIPPAIRERLFSPFFTTKDSHGTGLGLWVTRGMVQKHGGAISYRTCTEIPSGTVFRVFLPSKFSRLDSFNSPSSEFLQ
jgi:PAS domain S-box-containing protein